MNYLVSQLALVLAAMGLLGLLLGWWLARSAGRRRAEEASAEFESRLASTEGERQEAALEVTRLAGQVAETKVELEETLDRTVTAPAGPTEGEVERLRQVELQLRQLTDLSAAREEEMEQVRLHGEAANRDLVATDQLWQRAKAAEESQNMAAELLSSELDAQRQHGARLDERIETLETQAAAADEARIEAESQRDTLSRELESLLTAPLVDVDRMTTVKPIVFEEDPGPPTTSSAPEFLEAPRGAADDLRRIRGIGEVLAKTLNSLGIYHFHQIAGWSESDIQWVAAHINTFPDRIVRDEWREQAAEFEREKQSPLG